MESITTELFDHYHMTEEDIISKNNLKLCQADYFQTCWCPLNSSESTKCSYLLRHAPSFSNSSYYCIYHTIRKMVECFNAHHIIPKTTVSNIHLYLSLMLFTIGMIGNGISTLILLSTKLRHLSVYRNLTILCLLNIFYLTLILIRDENIYKQDLRNFSMDFCRLHVFLTAFIGHLCSWQLVSTSIQRVYALLSLQSHRTASWIRTWSIFFLCIFIPLFTFDGQILFNYGIFRDKHVCKEILNNDIRQLRHALNYPIELSTNTSIIYYTPWIPSPTEPVKKGSICFLWNIFDIAIYAIIPFIIIVICSCIIIVKVCQRRRSTVILGGICHINRDVMVSPYDYLSTLLITTNVLYFMMTGPLNICLLVQSLFECIFFESSPLSSKIFDCINEYLRLLQNSYHALSFVFYCVIGNKFRSSAKSICRTIYSKLIEFGLVDRCAETPMVSCCLDRRRSSSSGQTASTASRLSDNRRLTFEHRPTNSIPLHNMRRPTYITSEPNHRMTLLYKSEKV